MSNELWIGLLIGVPIGAFAPEWAKIVVFLVALVLSDLAHGVSHSLNNVRNVHNAQNVHFMVPLWLIGVAGIAFGMWAWHYARKRGLGHLGQAELRTRWTAVRGSSKWGW